MRNIRPQDLPAILRQLQAPRRVRQALGDYSAGDPNVGTDMPGYSEQEWFMAAGAVDAQAAAAANQPQDAPGYAGIYWSCTNYQFAKGSSLQPLTSDPNRVVLIVQNQHPTDELAVNFGQSAQITTIGAYTAYQGILIQAGGSLYVDRYCSTDSIYVQGLNNTIAAIIQGTRGPPVGQASAVTGPVYQYQNPGAG